jgi:hypothetical protein
MSAFEAKTIIKDQYWILRKNKIKIGQVTQEESGLEVRINGKHARTFKTLSEMKKSGLFTFTEMPKPKAKKATDVHGYPVSGTAYNPLWNLQYRLPLYTKTADSKSWYAAGYYIILKDKRTVEFCPKLITLQRNKFEGPFQTEPKLINDDIFSEEA